MSILEQVELEIKDQDVALQVDSSVDKYQLGDGISAYDSEVIKSNPFQSSKIEPKPGDIMSNAFSSYRRVFTSMQQYHSASESSSGLGINLGFFKLGHKKKKSSMDNVSSHTVIFMGTALRKCRTMLLEEDDIASCVKDVAKGLSPRQFYEQYGAYYVSRVTQGYYAKVLVTINAHSKEHAEGMQKELEMAVKTDDGSGDFSWKNANATKSKLREFGGIEVIDHNLPDIEESYQGLDVLNYLDLVEQTNPRECNSAMSVDFSRYPVVDGFDPSAYSLGDEASLAIEGDGREANLSFLTDQFTAANLQLDELSLYQNYRANYTMNNALGKSEVEVNEHWLRLIESIDEYIGTINTNPQDAKAAAAYTKIKELAEKNADNELSLTTVKLSIESKYAEKTMPVLGFAQKAVWTQISGYSTALLYSVYNKLALKGVSENSATIKQWEHKTIMDIRSTDMSELVDFLNTLSPWQYLNASFQFNLETKMTHLIGNVTYPSA